MVRTSAGASRAAGLFPRRLAAALAISALSLASPTSPAAKEKKSPEPYALIAGSVFRNTGFSLAGAEVVVTPVSGPESRARTKKSRSVSDARGEFAIRVPARPMRYTVSVKAPGFQAQEKAVTIGGDERTDLFFRLEPE
jgi:hypothetical protein